MVLSMILILDNVHSIDGIEYDTECASIDGIEYDTECASIDDTGT